MVTLQNLWVATTIINFINITLDNPAAASPLTSFLGYIDNSTKTIFNIRLDIYPRYAYYSFLDFIEATSHNPEAIHTIDRFGNFIAYFRALDPHVTTLSIDLLVKEV